MWHVPKENLSLAVDALRDGTFLGLSVTLPHKEAVMGLVDAVDPEARRLGAVNCLARAEGGRVMGFNTDGVGFVRALDTQGASLLNARVLVLGAGGAARAAVGAAVFARASEVQVANRSLDRARALARDFGASVHAIASTSEALQRALAQCEVLVNATSVGLNDAAACPLPEDVCLSATATVLDMVYRPLRTRLLLRAEAAGARTVDGLWMLIHQALEQLRLWTGFEGDALLATRLHAHLCEELP